MKESKFSILFLMCLLVFASCNADMDEATSLSKNDAKILNLLGDNVEMRDGVLTFESKEELADLLAKLTTAEKSVSKTRASMGIPASEISFKEEGFRSMYDVYGEALEDAPEYYESWEGYAAYKEKYSSFYFPEVGDDYSIYLPISDKSIAKLANEDGFVMVDGELVDCKDISTYEDLDRFGLTPPNGKTKSTEIFSREEGKQKLWIKYSQASAIAEIHMEVCFRQKKLGIWFNRKASTTLTLAKCDCNLVSVPTAAYNIGSFWSGSKNDEFSSHDYYISPGKLVGGGFSGYTGAVTWGPWGSTKFGFTFRK